MIMVGLMSTECRRMARPRLPEFAPNRDSRSAAGGANRIVGPTMLLAGGPGAALGPAEVTLGPAAATPGTGIDHLDTF